MKYCSLLLLVATATSAEFTIPLKKSLKTAKTSRLETFNILPRGNPMAHVPLVDKQEVSYSGEIQIGSQSAALDVIFDTGSGWLAATNT